MKLNCFDPVQRLHLFRQNLRPIRNLRNIVVCETENLQPNDVSDTPNRIFIKYVRIATASLLETSSGLRIDGISLNS